MKLESDTCTLIPPLFQPLRLWTPRVAPAPVPPVSRVGSAVSKAAPMRTFSMRGGFVTTDGARRMVIAGKLFRGRE